MPSDLYQYQVKAIWENNPDTPLTSAALSKSADLVPSYRDFDTTMVGGIQYHKEKSFIIKGPVGVTPYDPSNADTILIKRHTRLGIINEAQDPPDSGNYVIPTNDHYRLFDVGLEDIHLTVWDLDDNSYTPNPGTGYPWWGQNKEWFVYLCDMDDTSELDSPTEKHLGGAEFLISTSRLYPIGQVAGRPTAFYSENDTRKVGGFKSDNSGNIIDGSVWDISNKHDDISAKQYYILDDFVNDPEDPTYGRHTYRPLRLSDLDSETGVSNVLDSDLTVNGILTVKDSTNVLVANPSSNSVISTGNFTNTENAYFNNSDTQIADITTANITTENTTTANIITANITDINADQLIASNADGVRLKQANHSVIIRNDDTNFYLLNTDVGDTDGTWNTNRPFSFNLTSGDVSMQHNLDVDGTVKIGTAGTLQAGQTVPAGTATLGYNGYFYATRVYNAVYNDLAEYFMSISELKAGKVYTLHGDGNVKISDTRADKKVVGVCSDTAAFLMKEEYAKKGGVPIALAGTVEVFVCSKVREGDELVSDKNGFAARASMFERLFKRSSILGKALRGSDNNDDKRILMLVK